MKAALFSSGLMSCVRSFSTSGFNAADGRTRTVIAPEALGVLFVTLARGCGRARAGIRY